jgi:hypothetical protein
MKTPIWYVLGLWILWMLQFILFHGSRRRPHASVHPQYPRSGVSLSRVMWSRRGPFGAVLGNSLHQNFR